MSELRVDNIVDMGGSGAPQLRKGASVTGISTITQAVVGNATINAGGINATGIVTSSSNKFVGDLASGNITAGVMTATSSVVASNITINSGGVNASGIVSATSYQGSGANLTGIGLSIAPLMYNPDVSDGNVLFGTGIGLTFNQRVSAGTGNVTLSLVAVGSTVVENFGVGSSVSIDGNTVTINPTADLSKDTVYAISYPSGAFTQSGAGGSFVGTAYTFSTTPVNNELWVMGNNSAGNLGQNDTVQYSSPVQIPGTDWVKAHNQAAIKHNGTLWMWGGNHMGQLGQNEGGSPSLRVSSPVQIPGSWSEIAHGHYYSAGGIKTDGSLWTWGSNAYGMLGHNQAVPVNYSSPVQVGSETTWSSIKAFGQSAFAAIKTDGTLWSWGYNAQGKLGGNFTGHRSSPIQVPGTNWSQVGGTRYQMMALRTDGTLWACGFNSPGALGLNDRANRSSPTQIPGTNWSKIANSETTSQTPMAIKTDGTLWAWGSNYDGQLGQNNTTYYSSPVQIPGTTWDSFAGITAYSQGASKTDGTLWVWGQNIKGELGQNQSGNNSGLSSPTQLPGTWNIVDGGAATYARYIIKEA